MHDWLEQSELVSESRQHIVFEGHRVCLRCHVDRQAGACEVSTATKIGTQDTQHSGAGGGGARCPKTLSGIGGHAVADYLL